MNKMNEKNQQIEAEVEVIPEENSLVRRDQTEETRLSRYADVDEIVAIRERVEEVYRKILRPDVHFMSFGGAGSKPSLLKAGAEALGNTFRIAAYYDVEDLSDSDECRFRVTATGRHMITGAELGQGVGECSSNEERYKWRRAVSDDEFNAFDENERRVKFYRGKQRGSSYTVKQVRAEVADQRNTILKMAKKRAYVDMVISVTGCSSIFTQDIEDMPVDVKKGSGSGNRAGNSSGSSARKGNQKAEGNQVGNQEGEWSFGEEDRIRLEAKAAAKGFKMEDIRLVLHKDFNGKELNELTKEEYNALIDRIDSARG